MCNAYNGHPLVMSVVNIRLTALERYPRGLLVNVRQSHCWKYAVRTSSPVNKASDAKSSTKPWAFSLSDRIAFSNGGLDQEWDSPAELVNWDHAGGCPAHPSLGSRGLPGEWHVVHVPLPVTSTPPTAIPNPAHHSSTQRHRLAFSGGMTTLPPPYSLLWLVHCRPLR